MFNEHDTVVVRSLLTPTRQLAGTDSVKRQPRVGDQGSIVHVLGPDVFVVESVDGEGMTVWLADFRGDELAAEPAGWHFSADEISAGVYRARGVGPGGMSVETTDTDQSLALAACRKFACGTPDLTREPANPAMKRTKPATLNSEPVHITRMRPTW